MSHEISTLPRHLLTVLSGIACLCLATSGWAQSPVEVDSIDALTQNEQLQQQLIELESRLGRHDAALVENLVSLAESTASLDLYVEASSILDRAIQIQRLNLGLFTVEQLPLILAKMDYDTRAGDWETVNESMDHLYWLLIEKNVIGGDARIDNLIRLSEFHLKGVAGDTVDQQAHHYQQAARINYLALQISEQSWGSHDPRRIDLYYSLVKQFYLQSVAVERRDATAYALRAVVPGSNWVSPRRTVQGRYYRAGLSLLNEIRTIIAESAENPAESLAMVDLYTADWHLLFNQKRAEAAYMNAFEGLREAEADSTELDRLFAAPQILPIATFHGTVSTALATIHSDRISQQAALGMEADSYLHFQEWFDTMPVIPFPVIAPALGQVSQAKLTDIRLRFSLDSLNKVSRWTGGRYQSHISVADEFDILESDDHPDINMESFDERLRLLHFRPRLENGLARPSEGTLLYRAAVN